MINRDDIEAGDKCFTRDGGCLVARVNKSGCIYIGGFTLEAFDPTGLFYTEERIHPLDIIRIEKAPKPVVEEAFIVSEDNGKTWFKPINPHEDKTRMVVKLTSINGKLEKSEQVK